MKFAIFNGFNFHYETFGVFLFYIFSTGHDVTIFSPQVCDSGWFNFYRRLFGDEFCVVKHPREFDAESFIEHDFTIITTDDDRMFDDRLLEIPGAQDKILCYDHFKITRRPTVKWHVGTRPFITGGRPDLPFIIPSYPIVSKEQKARSLAEETYINVTLVGGIDHFDKYVDYLRANNDLSKVKFYFVRRWTDDEKRARLAALGINHEILVYLDTSMMFDLLRRSHYTIFTDEDEHMFNTASGSIGLTFSTGCTMLMSKAYNTDYKFKNVLYFDDYPTLKSTPDLDVVYAQQAEIFERNRQILDDFVEKKGRFAN